VRDVPFSQRDYFTHNNINEWLVKDFCHIYHSIFHFYDFLNWNTKHYKTPIDLNNKNYQLQDDDTSTQSYVEYDTHNNKLYPPHRQHKPYHDHEFEYPPRTTAKIITSTRFMSSVKDSISEYTTHTVNDLDMLYANLFNHLRAHTMFIHTYQDINHDDGVELLDKSNCINYDNTRRIISENIFLFFNTYKTKIFPNLPSLQAELS